MWAGIKKWFIAGGVVIMSVAVISVLNRDKTTNALESTNRNELYSPDEYNVAVSNKDGYVKLYENNNFEYYYSSSKSILQMVNKKSGFVWSTGAIQETKEEVIARCSGISKYSNDYYSCNIDVGPNKTGGNTDATIAEVNSLMYFTYFDPNNLKSDDVKLFTSANLYGNAHSLKEWMFKTTYHAEATNSEGVTQVNADFAINMRLTFTDNGFDVHIYDDDISGETVEYLEAIYPLPRLGQSGGKIIQCRIGEDGSCNFDDYSTITDNPNTNLDGYIFVPDGSGALIRFDNIKYYNANDIVYFDMYKDPYRDTFTKNEFSSAIYVTEPDYVATKHIYMPVWGVSYGNEQDAFVAYVTSGDEYFGLYYQGRSDAYEYAAIQPRFERNRSYSFTFGNATATQILGEDEVYHYDIGISYQFLQGDGSDGELPASYVGMALKYRDYLQSNHLVKEDVSLTVGPKVDFLICDVKEGLFGYTDVNVTNCDEIEEMLSTLYDDGVRNIISTLYGWQNGGMSKAKPWTSKYNKVAGGKKGFKDLLETASEYDYNLSFYQQYGLINAEQVTSFNAYCVKALSRDYGAYVLSDTNKPITWWEYVNADNAGEWLNKQAKALSKLSDNVGITTGGISTLLVPDYGKDLSYSDAANALYQATKEASYEHNVTLSGDTPNAYLWKNYDNFFNVSVYNSQLQCETDSVPFLSIVMSGLVNMYAEYSNFSFYDKTSQLKMIDYNLNPSFIITAEENTDIMYTNARDWFTTSFASYHDIINEIYDFVKDPLTLISGKTMVDREVCELPNNELGLYINTYATYENGTIGDDKVYLAINYLDHDVTYTFNNTVYTIPKESAMQLR